MIKNNKKTTEKDRKIVNILGINIISTTNEELLARVNYFLAHSKKFYIVTPNPELVLMAQGNPELKKALNGAELPVPDGIGLSYASRFLYGKPVKVIHGRKLFDDLIEIADKNKLKVFLLGGKGDEAGAAARKLGAKYKELSIRSERGPNLNKDARPEEGIDEKLEADAIDRINSFAPDLLFVAFGNPKQEIWINKNFDKLKIKGAMAVGGTFRYVAGMSKLPPRLLERLELEWLWRLITEPARFGRVINASIIFPLRVFIFKLTGK